MYLLSHTFFMINETKEPFTKFLLWSSEGLIKTRVIIDL